MPNPGLRARGGQQKGEGERERERENSELYYFIKAGREKRKEGTKIPSLNFGFDTELQNPLAFVKLLISVTALYCNFRTLD